MMTVKQQIQAEIIAAMKGGAAFAERKLVLRSLQAAIRQVEIDSQVTLDSDEDVQRIIYKEVKSQQEALVDAQKAKRADLMEQATNRMAILREFLPPMLSEEDIAVVVQGVLAQVREENPTASTSQLFGSVMKAVLAKTDKRADSKTVQKVITQILSPAATPSL